MTSQGDVRPHASGPAGEAAEGGKPQQFRLATAMALIVGSIIGVGAFNLPTSLATYGPISLVSMALTTVGALVLALLFAALSRRLPADGGPYAYAGVALGNRLGFANAWSYWITVWAGNAAIAVGWVLYVEHSVNKGHNRFFSVMLVLVGLWVPALINLSGVKNMGAVRVHRCGRDGGRRHLRSARRRRRGGGVGRLAVVPPRRGRSRACRATPSPGSAPGTRRPVGCSSCASGFRSSASSRGWRPRTSSDWYACSNRTRTWSR